MELKFSACDVRSLGMLHMDVYCQDFGFLHLMHLPRIQRPTTMLLDTHHCGLTILVVAQGMCGVEKYLVMERKHQTWIKIFVDGFV